MSTTMTADEIRAFIANLTPGDIYRYHPVDSWCRHGLALVCRAAVSRKLAGFVADTYWYGINYQGFHGVHGILWHESMLSQMTSTSRIGNVEDFRKSSRDECQRYAKNDVLYIPIGGGGEKWLIRKDAQPDLDMSINAAEYDLREAAFQARSYSDKVVEVLRQLDTLRRA